MKRVFLLLGTLLGFLLLGSVGLGRAQSILAQEDLTATFTYQGFLMMSGQPANGQYDFQFKLYDALTSGNQVGGTVTMEHVQVTDGVFTVLLPFDADVFDGHRRWLEVAVRDPNEGTNYTVLEPRQELTATPYAIYSLHAPWSGLTGIPADFADGVDNDTTYTAGTGLTLSGDAFSIAIAYRLPQGCGDGQIAMWNGSEWACANASNGDITAVYAGTGLIGGGESGDVTLSADTSFLQRRVSGSCPLGSSIRIIDTDGSVICETDDDTTTFWSLTGNTGTDPSANFLGTTDNQPLEIRVNNARALRIEPADTPNLIGGYQGNSVTGGVTGAVIAGGGLSSAENKVTDDYGTIGGGSQNQAGDADSDTTNAIYATVSGGVQNTASGDYATVSGGYANNASRLNATVGGGNANAANSNYATVSGGYQNTASGDYATVGGGAVNIASGFIATVGGGYYNKAMADYATIAGGGPSDPSNADTTNNTVTDDYGTIGGGGQNQAGDADSDTTNATYATVSGGKQNTASGSNATVSGGYKNTASGLFATVGGGTANTASDESATVGGGNANTASGQRATVSGGWENTASSALATVGGGRQNTASGQYATVPGGYHNTAEGGLSLAAGRQAHADASGCFVWGDSSTDNEVTCNSTANRTVFRSAGGFYIYTKSDLSTGVFLPANGNSWNAVSDRATKDAFTPVDKEALLARLAAMPVRAYHIKGQAPSIRHVGPVAQDFYAAFGYGETDHAINMEDAAGVSFAAIQGLYAENQQLKAENAALRAQLADQQRQLNALSARVDALEQAQVTHGWASHDEILPMLGLLLAGVGFYFKRRKEVKK